MPAPHPWPRFPEPPASEAARYGAMSPEHRLLELRVLCLDAARLLALNPNRERILQVRDPLPASSEAALARLRAARRSHG